MKTPFKLKGVHAKARVGVLKTRHGKIQTPFFMPVATKGSVKLLTFEELSKMKTECVISNGYILSLRPGLDTIQKAGGLHKFVNWQGGIFTDSGGFQILRPEFFTRITDMEVEFRNPFDRRADFLSPEKSIMIQNRLGSDVAMCLDDVPTFGSDAARLQESVERTFAWAKRCKEAHSNKDQLLFGIAQGGTNEKLRKRSCEQIAGLDFDGFALGGLRIGEPAALTQKMVLISASLFEESKPRYLMGVGSPQDLFAAVESGVDCFDSAFPTQVARHGLAFSHLGRINISNSKHRFELKPLDSDCRCLVCESHSRAYLHHLVRTGEENGLKYLSYHNLFFIQSLVDEIRVSIAQESLSGLKKEYSFSKM